MTGHINKFEKNKITMSLMVKDKQLLENYNEIWKKNERLMNIDFESETTYGYDDKYVKTRIKTYKDNKITTFYDKTGFKEVPEEKIPHECLSIIILDSVIYTYEKYYSQTFLEECKYVWSKNYINNELKLESGFYIKESDSVSDNDIYIEE